MDFLNSGKKIFTFRHALIQHILFIPKSLAMYTYNHKFERAARARRAKAVFFTILLHLLLIAGIAYSTGADMDMYTPEFVKTLLGVEADGAATAKVDVPKP